MFLINISILIFFIRKMGKPQAKHYQTKFKGKKLSTNALIAEREKRKLYFKYQKTLKKEAKKNPIDNSSTIARNSNESFAKNNDDIGASNFKNKKFDKNLNSHKMSSYKKAQLEYESKNKEKEEKKKVN